MMKIKLIQSWSETKLEKKVNDFIAKKDIKVLELQYGAASLYFSVMIVYEDGSL